MNIYREAAELLGLECNNKRIDYSENYYIYTDEPATAPYLAYKICEKEEWTIERVETMDCYCVWDRHNSIATNINTIEEATEKVIELFVEKHKPDAPIIPTDGKVDISIMRDGKVIGKIMDVKIEWS